MNDTCGNRLRCCGNWRFHRCFKHCSRHLAPGQSQRASLRNLAGLSGYVAHCLGWVCFLCQDLVGTDLILSSEA